jgi:hypothetical protein
MIEGIVEQILFPPNFVDYTHYKGAMRKDK